MMIDIRSVPERQRARAKLPWMILILAAISLVVAGCQLDLGPDPTTTPPVEASFTPGPPTDTQVSLNLATHTPTSIPENSPTPTALPETPAFDLPPDSRVGADPWRPPVYPVPWVPGPYDHFYFTNPIAAADIDHYFSTYGYGDVFFENVVHTGIDIPGDIGTPILAAGPGKVIYAGQGVYRGGDDVFDDPYGNAVVIEHSFSYQGEPLFTLYAHLDEIQVRKGQEVALGQQIGLLGETGKTTGPHLHFEVRVGKNEYFSTRNPDLWISPPQGWGVLVARIYTYEGRLHEQQVVYLYRDENAPSSAEAENNLWIAKSYQNEAINSDPYYQENLSIANIPAGKYYLSIPVTQIGFTYQKEVVIRPGQVTFVKFNVWRGFDNITPQPPEISFSPSP